MNNLDSLKTMTTVVADTGDINSIKQYTPTDATTNPSLIYQAACLDEYQNLVDSAIEYASSKSLDIDEQIEICIDKLFITFGIEILKTVPGRVSTEVDADLSFDTEKTIEKARKFIAAYEEAGISKDRILIKIASTWEGIKAAEQLEKEGIHCNLTLLFCISQAIACAEAGVQLISPFVGRILDWYKKDTGKESYAPNEDPGVVSVSGIFNYYKKFGHKTEIMGASFRNMEEITELSGCDLLTISPGLLQSLMDTDGELPKKLNADQASDMNIEKVDMNEKTFRWMMNENPMATEKLAQGIRSFTVDLNKLKDLIRGKIVK